MTDDESPRNLPWILPLKKPNFYFPKIRVGIPTIPDWVLPGGIFVGLFYIFSGGVYLLVTGNVPAYYYPANGTIQLIYNRECTVSKQYLMEGIVAAMLISMGSLGLYLVNKATDDPHNPNRAFMYQFIGSILLLISILIIENMMHIKTCADKK